MCATNALKIVRYVTSLTFVMFVRERTANPMTELKPCPFCGGEAQIRMVGDLKHLLMYGCENKSCFKTPLRGCDARSTEREARKVWNRRVDEWNRRVKSDV